jgi:hypothetical protein
LGQGEGLAVLMRKEKRAGGGRTPRRLRPPLPEGDTAGSLELPAIVRRAQDEARSAHALRCLGYRTVRTEYARHRRAGRDTFSAIAHVELWPTMEFVRAWLKGERRRILANIRMTFLAAMLAAILAGLAFAGVLAFLS